MGETTLKKVQSFGLLALVLAGCLAGWNAFAVQSRTAVSDVPPSVGEFAAVALPSLASLSGGLAALVSFIIRKWKERKAAAPAGPTIDPAFILPIAPQSLSKMLGSPAAGTVRLKWPGRTEFSAEWSGGELESNQPQPQESTK